jgi:hypothetical protein
VTPLAVHVVGLIGTTDWIDAGSFSGQSTYCYLDGIPKTQGLNVQIRAVRANGAASAWVTLSISNAPRPRPLIASTSLIFGTTVNPTVASSFADLPELGSSDAGMTIVCDGNAALVSLSLGFAAVASGGGAVTGIPGLSLPTTTGLGPPSISISIYGDGSGALAHVAWVNGGGSGSGTTWIPTLVISSGGSGYTTATATVNVISNGDAGYFNGTFSYSCTISSSTPTSGVPISVQVLMDGAVIIGPVTVTTDGTGHASYNTLQLIVPAAGSRVFEVEAMTSASGVTSTTRSITFVELG